MSSKYKIESTTSSSQIFKGEYLRGLLNTFKIDDIKEKISELRTFIQSNTEKLESLKNIEINKEAINNLFSLYEQTNDQLEAISNRYNIMESVLLEQIELVDFFTGRQGDVTLPSGEKTLSARINELNTKFDEVEEKLDSSLQAPNERIEAIENEITQHLYPLEGLMYTTYEYVVGGEPDEHESNVFVNENVASCLTQMFRQDGLLDKLWNSRIQNTENINTIQNKMDSFETVLETLNLTETIPYIESKIDSLTDLVELRELDLPSRVVLYDSYSEEITNQRDEINTIKNKMDSFENLLETLNSEISEINNSLDQLTIDQNYLISLQTDIQKIKGDIETLNSKTRILGDQHPGLPI